VLEYRVLDSSSGLIATLVIQGSFQADAARFGREAIIDNANRIAAEHIAWELNTRVAETIGIKPRRHVLAGEQPCVYPSALWGTPNR
jgi:hypothetical protein